MYKMLNINIYNLYIKWQRIFDGLKFITWLNYRYIEKFISKDQLKLIAEIKGCSLFI